MQYYVVTFTHTKIVGWAIIEWDPKFGEFR